MTVGAVLTLVGGLVVLLVAITLWSNNWSRATVGISIESLSNIAGLALIALILAQLDLSSLITVLSGSSANSILSDTTVSGELSNRAVLALVAGLVELLVAITLWSLDNWSWLLAIVSESIEGLSKLALLALIALILAQLNLTLSITVLGSLSTHHVLGAKTVV